MNPPCVCSSCDETNAPPLFPLLHRLPPIPQIFIFIGETLLSMNWAIVADILLVSRWPRVTPEADGSREWGQGTSLALNCDLHPFFKTQPWTDFRVQPQVGL